MLSEPAPIGGQRSRGRRQPHEVTHQADSIWHTGWTDSSSVRAAERWDRLSRKAVESPSLGMFETCLDVVLCSVL